VTPLGTFPYPRGGQADFARPEGPAAAADERHDGGVVVWGAERRAADERARGERVARGRVHACHPQGLVGAERRQQAGEPLGEHRLARTGRPDYQEMVGSGGCHLEGTPAQGPAPRVGQVGYRALKSTSGRTEHLTTRSEIFGGSIGAKCLVEQPRSRKR
jgi:hypothetical protein